MAFQLDNKNAVKHLKDTLGHNDFKLEKVNLNKTFINTTSKEDYNKTLDILKKANVEFFNFTPKEEKPLNFLIKQIPSGYTADEIREDLDNLNININIIKIEPFTTNNSLKNNINLGIWRLQLQNGDDIS